jgi:cobalt-zinc-cadmium resistance protein CzcA
MDTAGNPALRYYSDALQLADRRINLEQQQLLPDLKASVFRGFNNGTGIQSYPGFQVGIGIPLWFGAQKAKINAAKTGASILGSQFENYKMQLSSQYRSLQSDLKKYEEGINYYQLSGKKLSEETVVHATKAFQNGEIDFLQYIQLLENAVAIETNYLSALFQYNLTVLEANYIMN